MGGLTSKSRGRLLDGEEWNEVPSKRSPTSTPSDEASVRKNTANSQFAADAMQTESRSRKGTPWHEACFDGPRRLTSKVKHLILQSYVKEFVFHLGSVRERGEYRKAVIGLKQAGRLQQLDPGRASNESTRFRVIKNLPPQVSAQLPLLLHSAENQELQVVRAKGAVGGLNPRIWRGPGYQPCLSWSTRTGGRSGAPVRRP